MQFEASDAFTLRIERPDGQVDEAAIRMGNLEGDGGRWVEELELNAPPIEIPVYVKIFVLLFLLLEVGGALVWMVVLTRRPRKVVGTTSADS